MTNTLQAFHNDKKIKKQYLKRVECHRKSDEIIHGTYWENGKGCALGCTIHSSCHNKYEIELGIPEWLAYLEDTIFEHLPNGKAKLFPERFLKAIPIGVDLNNIKGKVMAMIVQKALDVLFTLKKTDNEQVNQAIEGSKKVCQAVIELWKSNNPARSAARSAAGSAAESAWSAAESAWSAAESAWSAAESAWSAAESAWSAWSAAESAWSAAESAWSAARSAGSAWSAAWSAAESARSARSAAESAWSAAWVDISEELLKILESSK